MEIRTFTRIFTTGKVLYAFGDLTLPRPVAIASIGGFIITAVVWVPLLFIVLSVPFNPYTAIIGFGPPIFVGYSVNKPIFERKTLFEYLQSQVLFFRESRYLTDMRDDSSPEVESFVTEPLVWEPGREVQPKVREKKAKRR